MLENIPDLQLNIQFDDDEPVVGILMPCYNHSQYIEEAIQSVILQDYTNKVLIVIDDKSTDNSVQVVLDLMSVTQQILDDDSEIVTVGKIKNLDAVLIQRSENRKQAAARNKGILTSWHYCDYYCQLDADDWYLPEKLSKTMQVAVSDPENIGLVYNDIIIHNTLNQTKVYEFREPYSWENLLRECIISNTALINKQAFQQVGLYDKDISPTEDYFLWLCICHQFMAVHVPEPLSAYRVTSQSCTFTVPSERWQQCWATIRDRIQKNIFHNPTQDHV